MADIVLPSELAQRAFDRTSGSPLIGGNKVDVLHDAAENYPAWLEAIRAARKSVFFENYIIDEDEVGDAFADALIERARAGVAVRLIRDWLGSRAGASRRFWRRLAEAGVELRLYNPPTPLSPFGWVSRDHRKMLCVDGKVGFVSGLCVSQRWLGDPSRNVPAWRDTGLRLEGPAVPRLERAFAEVWSVTGPPLPKSALTDEASIAEAGEVGVRVIAGEPRSAELFRLDQMIAAAAMHRLWLTDAYFVGVVPYVQALRAAARDGVDVRLLTPSTTDLPFVSPLSRSGYRPLLEAGVRIFEWNGSMIHAKTAVADGRWARVGSSNLNLTSFIGNYELDVAVEHASVARTLEAAYERDLENATEITLNGKRVVPAKPRRHQSARGGSVGSAGAVRFANAVGVAATSGTRALGLIETSIELVLALVLLIFSAIAVVAPRAVAYPLAALSAWLSVALLLRAHRNERLRRAERQLAEARPRAQPTRAREAQ